MLPSTRVCFSEPQNSVSLLCPNQDRDPCYRNELISYRGTGTESGLVQNVTRFLTTGHMQIKKKKKRQLQQYTCTE